MALKRLVLLLGLAFSVSACAPLFADHYPYRGGPSYPAPYSQGPGAERAAIDYASHAGYRDGFELGYDAGRDRDRYEPRSHRRFRSGDHGYRRDLYMTRDYYTDLYRRGFLSGYEAGYRQGQTELRRGRRW